MFKYFYLTKLQCNHQPFSSSALIKRFYFCHVQQPFSSSTLLTRLYLCHVIVQQLFNSSTLLKRLYLCHVQQHFSRSALLWRLYLYHVQQHRVGNLLIGFSSESLFFVSERTESVIHSAFLSESHFRSFVKSDVIEQLMSLFKKEQLSEELREWFTLRHKKGKNCQQNSKSMIFMIFLVNCLFLRAIRLNHERITYVALLSWAMRAKSERAKERKSEFPTL